jgi:hypothetical protein
MKDEGGRMKDGGSKRNGDTEKGRLGEERTDTETG